VFCVVFALSCSSLPSGIINSSYRCLEDAWPASATLSAWYACELVFPMRSWHGRGAWSDGGPPGCRAEDAWGRCAGRTTRPKPLSSDRQRPVARPRLMRLDGGGPDAGRVRLDRVRGTGSCCGCGRRTSRTTTRRLELPSSPSGLQPDLRRRRPRLVATPISRPWRRTRRSTSNRTATASYRAVRKRDPPSSLRTKTTSSASSASASAARMSAAVEDALTSSSRCISRTAKRNATEPTLLHHSSDRETKHPYTQCKRRVATGKNAHGPVG